MTPRPLWRSGTVHTRHFGKLGHHVEIRDDICAGWCATLYGVNISVWWCEFDTLAAAKRAAMREAKRLGWLP